MEQATKQQEEQAKNKEIEQIATGAADNRMIS